VPAVARLSPPLAARDGRVTAPALLSFQGVTKRFGGVAAFDGVSFEVAEGEILGVIGPNGAGKTTLLKCVSGVHRPDDGAISLDGTVISGLPPHRIARPVV